MRGGTSVSRLPRELELLKTGFTAEAVSAARYRACAARAERDGLPKLARHWLDLAAEKDGLAILQLEAAGRIHGEQEDLETAIAEDSYENDVLYPKLIEQVDGPTAKVFAQVVAAQNGHLERLEALRGELTASTADVAT
jgi:rubrerythrin